MTKKLRRVLSSQSGEAFPLTIALTLVLLIFFCGISEYFRLLSIAQSVRDTMQGAVISTVNDNYDDVYHGVREGYSGAYQPMGGRFEESLDYGDIYARLDSALGLSRSNGYHVKLTSERRTEYRLWGLSVKLSNAPLASGDNSAARFIADSAVELEVPVSFCGELLPPMRITVMSSAGYTPKF